MSDSSRPFYNLQPGGEMPVTRSQNQPSQPGDAPRRGRQARMNPIARSSSPRVGATGSGSMALSSPLEHSPDQHQSSMIDELTTKTSLKDMDNEYFAIQFNPASVRVPNPASDPSRAWCTCLSFREDEICYHTEVCTSS